MQKYVFGKNVQMLGHDIGKIRLREKISEKKVFGPNLVQYFFPNDGPVKNLIGKKFRSVQNIYIHIYKYIQNIYKQ